jgi:hypothetical protein
MTSIFKRAFGLISGTPKDDHTVSLSSSSQLVKEKHSKPAVKHVKLNLSGLDKALDTLNSTPDIVCDDKNDTYLAPIIPGKLLVRLLQSIPSSTDLEHQLVASRAVGSIILECTHSKHLACKPNTTTTEDSASWITPKAFTNTLDKFPELASSKDDLYLMMLLGHLFNIASASKLYHDFAHPERPARCFKLDRERNQIERCEIKLTKLNLSYTRKYITKLLQEVPELDAARVWTILSRVDIVPSKQIPAIVLSYERAHHAQTSHNGSRVET